MLHSHIKQLSFVSNFFQRSIICDPNRQAISSRSVCTLCVVAVVNKYENISLVIGYTLRKLHDSFNSRQIHSSVGQHASNLLYTGTQPQRNLLKCCNASPQFFIEQLDLLSEMLMVLLKCLLQWQLKHGSLSVEKRSPSKKLLPRQKHLSNLLILSAHTVFTCRHTFGSYWRTQFCSPSNGASFEMLQLKLVSFSVLYMI